MTDRAVPTQAPGDWHQAFAALPLEAPPGDGWQRIAERMPVPPRRRRRATPWAIAAATATLAILPALVLLRAPPPLQPAPPVADAAPASPGATSGVETTTTMHLPPTDTDATPRAGVPVAVPPPDPARPRAPEQDIALEALHAESARLEALLAELAGDAESGDGVQIALAASLRSQVSDIDAALADAPLHAPDRAGLWRQRVAVLRELAGVTADQRWNALYGGAATGYALVQVY